MKSGIILNATFLAIILIQSCIPSLHPLYTKERIIYLTALEGVWTDRPTNVDVAAPKKTEDKIAAGKDNGPGQTAIWDFRKNKDGGYILIHQDNKGRKAAFEVYLVKLGNNYFMDFFLTDLPEKDYNEPLDLLDFDQNELASFHVVPVHTFAKLMVVNDKIKIKMFDPDFLEKLFKQRQIRIKHEQLDNGGIVLTAQPEELQKFVEKYADHKEAFIDDEIVLTK